jgi:tripartite-type tricarboxylate transporter receptor subunit TctC
LPLLVAFLAYALFVTPSRAQSVEEFYRGKTITIIIGTGENAGAVETYPRALAQVMKKYLPGSPTIIVSNMPGAGGIKAATYIHSIAPQDGTVWGFITRGFMLAPLMKIPQANFEPAKFNWIGSTARTVSVGIAWKESTPVRTLQDAMRTEMVLGATSAGQDTAVFPYALNKFAGTKFRVVTGYSSVGEVDYAIEKGEVQGKVGFTWAALNSGRQLEWLKAGKVQVLVQLGVEKAPNIPADVPLGLDFATTPEHKLALQVIAAPSATGFPSFMGPGVPKERVEAIRAAWTKSLQDPEFIDYVKRQGLDIDPIPGEELTKMVQGIYASPQSAVDQARTVMPQN